MCPNTGFVLSSLLIAFADILLVVVLSLFFRVLSKAARETGYVSCRIPGPYSPESKCFSIMLLVALLVVLAASAALYFTRRVHVLAAICSAVPLAFFLVHWLYWQCFSLARSFLYAFSATWLWLLALTWRDTPNQLWGFVPSVEVAEWMQWAVNISAGTGVAALVAYFGKFDLAEIKSLFLRNGEDTDKSAKDEQLTPLGQAQQSWEKCRLDFIKESGESFLRAFARVAVIAFCVLFLKFMIAEAQKEIETLPLRIYLLFLSPCVLFWSLKFAPDKSQLLDTERDYMGLASLRMRQGKSSKEEDKNFFQLFSHILYGSNLDDKDDCQDWAIKTAVATLSSKEPCLALVGFHLFQEYRKEYRACFVVTEGEGEFWKDYHEFYGTLSVKLIEKEDFSFGEDSPDSLSLLRGLHETFQQSLPSREWNQNLPRDYTWNNLHNMALGKWLETDLKEDVKSGKTLCGLCLRDCDNCVEMNRAEREEIALRVIALYPVIVFGKIIRQVQEEKEKNGDWQKERRKRACEEYFKRLLSDPPALPHRFQALKADKIYSEYGWMKFPERLHELSKSPYIDAVKAAVKNAPGLLKAPIARHKAKEGSKNTHETTLLKTLRNVGKRLSAKATVDDENKKIEDEQAIRELLCYLVARYAICDVAGEG